MAKNNNMLNIFGGKFIRIYTDDFKRIMDDQGNVQEIPIIVEGYLMDEDDEFYYLSYVLNPELISQAIKKHKALIVEDIELADQTMEELNEQVSIQEAMAERSKKQQLN